MASKPSSHPYKPTQDTLLDHLQQALRGIDSGTLEVVVHEGRVVQIERRQRLYPGRDAVPGLGPKIAPSPT